MKIASKSRLLLALILSVVPGPARAAETNATPQVGRLREFDRFTFEGATTFSSTNLWYALNSTFVFPEQSHPFAPRDVFLTAIGNHLKLGYQHCGFPDARISARYDPKADRVIVQIDEGPRYLCGPVEVIGPRKLPTQPIVAALTTTNAGTDILLRPFQFLDNDPANRAAEKDRNDVKDQDSVWIAGQPAYFDDLSLRWLSGMVTNTLRQHGFFLSRFSLNVVSNASARTVTLQVKIHDEGPPATIERIKVVGNRWNTRDGLLGYLGLKPGMGYKSDLAANIADRLYHSARFLTNSVLAGPPDSSGRLTLTIEVVENDQSPPLNAEFTPMEQTMLKARNWLAKVGETRDEAVLTVSGYPDEASSLQCVLAPRQGLLILDNEVTSGTNRLRHAVVASPDQIALYAPARQQKFVAHFSFNQIRSYVSLESKAPDEEGNSGNLTVGAGFSSLDDETNVPPWTLSVSLSPAAFVRLAHGTNSTCWFDGNQLISSNSSSVMKLDARTGHLIEFTFNSPAPDQTVLKLHFEPEVYAAALARVERQAVGFVNLYRTNAALAAAVGLLGSELVQVKLVDSLLRTKLPGDICAQIPALLRQLDTGALFATFKAVTDLQTAPDDPIETFEIPKAPHPSSGGTTSDWLMQGAQGILTRGDEMFPIRSWPWTLGRTVGFLVRGQQKYLLLDAHDIYESSATGPIGYLLTAEVLESQNATGAKDMAERGLERLSSDDFLRDCRLFLDENKLCGRLAAGVAAAVRDLDEQALHGLIEPLSVAGADFARDCIRRLRAAKKEQTLFEKIAPALDAYWQKELRRQTGDSLKKIAKE